MNRLKTVLLALSLSCMALQSQVQDVYKNYAYDNYTHWVGRSANKMKEFEPNMVQLANYYCIYLIANYNSDTETADSARTIINDIWNSTYSSSELPYFPNFNTLYQSVLDSISGSVIDSLATTGFATKDTLQYFVEITVFNDSLSDIRTSLGGITTSLGDYVTTTVFLDSLADIRAAMLSAGDVAAQINDSLSDHTYYEGQRIIDSIDAKIATFRDTTTLTSGGGIDLDGVADGQILYNNSGSLGTDAKFLFTGATRSTGFFDGTSTPIGTDTMKWNGRFFAANLYAANALNVAGLATINTLSVTGNATVNGNTTLGDAPTDTVTITGGLKVNDSTITPMSGILVNTTYLANEISDMVGFQDTLPGGTIATKAEVLAINYDLDSATIDTIGIVQDVDLTVGLNSINTGQPFSVPKVISIQDTSTNELVNVVDVRGYTYNTTWYINIYTSQAYDSLIIYYIKDDAGINPAGGGTTYTYDTIGVNDSIRIDTTWFTSGDIGGGEVDTFAAPLAGQIAIFETPTKIGGSDTLDYYKTWLETQDSINQSINENNDSLGLDLSTQVDNGIFFERGDSLATDAGFRFTEGTRTSGTWYTGVTDPISFNRFNYDGSLYTTKANFQFPTGGAITGTEPLTVYNPYPNSGQYAAKMTSIRPGVLSLIQNGTYTSSTHTSDVLNISRAISTGTVDITGNIIDITDNPTTTSGTISGGISYTVGSTERVGLYPRATGTAYGYFFDTHSTIDSVFDIRNNGVSLFKVTSNDVNISNDLTVSGNTTLGNASTDQLTVNDSSDIINSAIKVHRIDSINTTIINAWVDVKFDTVVAAESTYGLAFNSDSTGIISSTSGLFQAKGCAHWLWSGGSPGDHKLYIRVTVNGVEKRCLQANDTRSNATGDDGTLPYMGTIRIVPNDEIKIQYYVTSADLDFVGDAVFDNPIAVSFNMFKISK